MNLKIAIDGPSGAGKSTIAKKLSKILTIPYLDTGALFRALAYALMGKNVDLSNESEVNRLLPNIDLSLQGERIIFEGEDISQSIRTDEISAAASKISQYSEVRNHVRTIEKILSGESIIMDGRDIGTVVLPDADFKFFVTASDTVRAKRRVEQLGLETSSYESVLSAIRKRDDEDRNRAEAPLKKASDAILINTDDETVDESIQRILAVIRGKQ